MSLQIYFQRGQGSGCTDDLRGALSLSLPLTGTDELSMHEPLWCDGPWQKGCRLWAVLVLNTWGEQSDDSQVACSPYTAACVHGCNVLPCYWYSWESQRTRRPGELLSLRRWKKCRDIWKSILWLWKKLSLRSFTGSLSLGIEQFSSMISEELLISQWKNSMKRLVDGNKGQASTFFRKRECSIPTELHSCLTIIPLWALFLIASPVLLLWACTRSPLLFRAMCSVVISSGLHWEPMSYSKWPLKRYKGANPSGIK